MGTIKVQNKKGFKTYIGFHSWDSLFYWLGTCNLKGLSNPDIKLIIHFDKSIGGLSK